MLDESHRLDAFFQEYDQLKEEIRTALDVYEKVYGSLVAVITAAAGILVATNIPEKGMLFALIPFVILGILGVVWYGHEIALARLSARLEVVEYRINRLLGQADLFSWQSHWANMSPSGLIGGWQRMLALLAMLPSAAIYLVAAALSDSWWISLVARWPGLSLPKGLPMVTYALVILTAFVLHEAWYMRRLRGTLRAEIDTQKKIDANANIGNYPYPGAEQASR